MMVVKVNSLKKQFNSFEVIKGLDFELKRGTCVALLGANGAGKTTTLQMLSGLMRPSSGRIIFSGLKADEDFRKMIGYLPQQAVFYDWMTGEEFLVYAGKLAGLNKQLAKKRANELLELVGIADAKNRRIGKYSGGMKQRLGIAQALIHQPNLVILDEPVSALDPFGRREVLELLGKLKKETTILFSTHILNDAEEVCDEILFLHDGKIVESGTMDELRERHQQAKIDVMFRGNTEHYVEQLSRVMDVLSITYEGNQASMFVEKVDEAKKNILQQVLKQEWPLLKFEISRTSLEDVFMKVVQK